MAVFGRFRQQESGDALIPPMLGGLREAKKHKKTHQPTRKAVKNSEKHNEKGREKIFECGFFFHDFVVV